MIYDDILKLNKKNCGFYPIRRYNLQYLIHNIHFIIVILVLPTYTFLNVNLD